MGTFSDFFNPMALQGASQGLLAGRQQQVALAEAAKDRAISQQLADQSNPVRLAASHALEALTTYIANPANLGELRAAGLLPHAQALSQALGQTASDGDFSHVNLVPHHDDIMGRVQGQGSPGAVQAGQGTAGGPSSPPGPISSFYAPGDQPGAATAGGGITTPTPAGGGPPTPPPPSVANTPYGGSSPPAASKVPNNGVGQPVTTGPFGGGSTGAGGFPPLGDINEPARISFIDANGAPLDVPAGQPVPVGAKLMVEATIAPGASVGPLLSTPSRIRFPVSIPPGVDPRTLSLDQLTPLVRQGFAEFATPAMRQHGWDLATDPTSDNFHYSLLGPEQKTGLSGSPPPVGAVVAAASHPGAPVTPPPVGAGPGGGVVPLGGSPAGVGTGGGAGGGSVAPSVSPFHLPPDLARAGIPTPPAVNNGPDPLAGAIHQLASTSTGILQGLAGVDPGNVQNIIDKTIRAVTQVPEVQDAWRIYQQAAAPGSMYLPSQVLQMATNFQSVLGNAWQIAFNAQMAPYEKRASILATASTATQAAGSNLAPIETAEAARIKAPSEAYQAGGLGAQAYTAADVALKAAEETARHNATQDQIDQAKPIISRIDQRWSERAMSANALGLGAGVNIQIFGTGGGINGNLTQSQRNMAAQMSTKQMISDVLALRELGLRGNTYAGAVADGYLKSLTAEYKANPSSVDVVPPNADTLTGLDYIHATTAQRAQIWSRASQSQRHEINQITGLAKAWEGEQDRNYKGPRYSDLAQGTGAAGGTGAGNNPVGGPTGPLSVGGQADQLAGVAQKHLWSPIARNAVDVFGPLFDVYSGEPSAKATTQQQDAAYQKIVQTAVRGIRSGGLGGAGTLDLTPVWSKVPRPAGAPDAIDRNDAGALQALYYYMTGPVGTPWGATPPAGTNGNWLNPWNINPVTGAKR